MKAKRLAAEKAAEKIKSGMVVGLGSGSTANWAIKKIGEMVKEGLQIEALASSVKSESLAKEYNIPLRSFEGLESIDIAIDGADEIDKNRNLIKGGGGSLLREKIIDFNSKLFYVIADESKLVNTLGKFPLPIEIIPFGHELTLKQLQLIGCTPVIRKIDDNPFISDNGNLIADCHFGIIKDPQDLNERLKMIVGVVETGLFSSRFVTSVFVGFENGDVRVF
jgi:ribose 5-phosphate isomerase A